METEYFECECHNPEHILRVTYDDEDKDWEQIYIDYQFYPDRNVLKRIWIAMKYVFKIKANYYPWDCIILWKKDIPRLVNLLNKIANTNELLKK